MLTTADGTAGAGDYTSTNVVVELLSGRPRAPSSTIPVTGDELDESDESFLVQLTLPSHATLADAEATGTIQDDDTLLVSAIDPSSGPASGAAVTVAGESFETGAALTVGGISATGVGVPEFRTDHRHDPGARARNRQRRRRVDLGAHARHAVRRILRGFPGRRRRASVPRLRRRRGEGRRHRRLRRRRLLPRNVRDAGPDGGVPSQGQVRVGARAAGRDRDRLRRRPAGVVRRGLDRGARLSRRSPEAAAAATTARPPP